MIEIAVIGGGCFWCTEAVYRRIKGVVHVQSGYAGGQTQDPTYLSISNGRTGHAEVVRIEFDSTVITYKDIIDIFWHVHDPTTLNRQGFDWGKQYRSIILYLDNDQKLIAHKSREEAERSGDFRNPIVTEIISFEKFYAASDFHQDFYSRNPNQPYCRVTVSPKVRSFMEQFPDILKDGY